MVRLPALALHLTASGELFIVYMYMCLCHHHRRQLWLTNDNYATAEQPTIQNSRHQCQVPLNC